MEVTQNHHKTFIERFRPVGTCHEPESASRFFLRGAHTEHTCVCAPRQKANGEKSTKYLKMETDSAVRQIPGESAAGEGGGGRDEGALSQDARAAAEARARGKKRCASNDDDADSDTELANTPI